MSDVAIKFRDLLPEDKEPFFAMVKQFYSSPAVLHAIGEENIHATFAAAMEKSPYMRALMIESMGNIAGYALLSFTFSNEAGGMVLIVEELYIKPEHRNAGIGKCFFEWIEKAYPMVKRFRLEVQPENQKAAALYKRIGYESLNYDQMIKDIR